MSRISVIAVMVILLVAVCLDHTEGGRVIRSPHHKFKSRGGGYQQYQPVGIVVLQPVYGGGGGGHRPHHGGGYQPSHGGYQPSHGGSQAFSHSSSGSGYGGSYASASSYASSYGK